MGFSRQAYWSGLPFPSPVDHGLSEVSTMTCLSWVSLHSMAHYLIELDKAVVHVISLISWNLACHCSFSMLHILQFVRSQGAQYHLYSMWLLGTSAGSPVSFFKHKWQESFRDTVDITLLLCAPILSLEWKSRLDDFIQMSYSTKTVIFLGSWALGEILGKTSPCS